MLPNDTNQAQQAALDVVSLMEQLEGLIRDFTAFTTVLPLEHRTEAEVYSQKLKAIFAAIDTQEISPQAIGVMSKSLASQYPSKIQRMGIASQLVSVREEGKYTLVEISERFGISPNTLRAFYSAYDSAKPSEKVKMKKNSVYDIQENMEGLHSMLLRTISRFELDGEINNRNLAEYRQLLALAQKQLKDFTTAQKFEKLATMVEEVLLQHCRPESRREVMAEFQRIGLTGFLDTVPSNKHLR